MILSGQKIKQSIQTGNLGIEPFIETHIKGASYTFALDSKILCLEEGQVLRTDKKPAYKESAIPDEGYLLQPAQFILGYTKETLQLNGNYACLLSARGSCAQIGLSVLIGSHFAEPDTNGKQILEITNVSGLPILLFGDMLIVKGIFMPLNAQE